MQKKSNQEININFFKAPNEVFDNSDLELSTSEKLVLLYLYRCSNEGSTAFPSLNKIGKVCAIHRSTAKRVIKSLEKKGLIRVDRRRLREKKNLSNIYQVLLLGGRTMNPPLNKGGRTMNPPVGAPWTQGGRTMNPYKELQYKKLINKEGEQINPPQTIPEHDHIKITEEQYNCLKERFGEEPTNQFIQKVGDWKAATGKKLQSDYHMIKKWITDEKDRGVDYEEKEKRRKSQLKANKKKDQLIDQWLERVEGQTR